MRFWKLGAKASWPAVFVVVGVLWGAAPGLVEAGFEEAPGGIRFTYEAPYAGKVFVTGEFSGWNATGTPMTKDANGVWSAVVGLGPGQHEYKFIVDDQWIADPDNPVTAGDYGNSVVSVGAGGKIQAMKATSNTELSPKVLLESRYITLMKTRRDETANPRWDFERPDFDVDLDFNIQINSDLRAHVLTNINNLNQNVQLWETNLVFDRGSLWLANEDLNLVAFDNEAVGSWDDPLSLVGNIGIYDHPWGFNQQGVLVWRNFGRFEARLLYSDNFEAGGTDGATPSNPLNLVGETPTPGSVTRSYSFSDTDNNKDVLAGRVKTEVASGLTLGASLRTDRGARPGGFVELVEMSPLSDSVRVFQSDSYTTTVENWAGGGVDVVYENDGAGIDLFGEFLIGEAVVDAQPGTGLREEIQLTLKPDGTLADTARAIGNPVDVMETVNTSRRFILGGHYFAYRAWHWRGSVEFQDHDVTNGPRFGFERYNRLTTYKLGLDFSGEEWKLWPWEAGLDFEYYDFNYDERAQWADQIWFDQQNFWLENNEHNVSVDRMVMLGGRDVVTFRPRAQWRFHPPRNAVIEYHGILSGTDIDTEPKYWENVFKLHVDLTRRLGLNLDTRIVRYDDDVLKINQTFASHFVELKYFFTPSIEVALSWGVDPWVIDPPTNEYAPIGRDLFLFERSANGAIAQSSFLDLGKSLSEAEQELEDEDRIQLEAIMRF